MIWHRLRVVLTPWGSRISFALLFSLALMVVFFVSSYVPAQAQPMATGYTLTLQPQNGLAFTYNSGNAPQFTAVLTPPTGVTPDPSLLKVTLNGQTLRIGMVSNGGNYFEYPAYSSWSSLSAGSFTALATYDQGGADATQSTPLMVTIGRAPTTTECYVDSSQENTVYKVGRTLKIVIIPKDSNRNQVDLHGATFGVTLTGPRTSAYTNLTPDSGGDVSVTLPTTVGSYNMTCTFNGTVSYAPSTGTATNELLHLSLANSLASVRLYTSPTTIHYNQNWEGYIVMRGPSGAPTPTGWFTVSLGGYCVSNGNTVLGSDGTLLVNFGPASTNCDINHITIYYNGDRYYNSGTYTFPGTNPPIPSSTGGGGTPGGGTGSPAQTNTTPTAGSHATLTVTAPTGTSPTGTASGTPGSVNLAGASGAGGPNDLPPWPLLVLALVVILGVGGGGIALVIARRASSRR